MVKLLLEHGANINSRNNFGETPLYCAVKSKSDRLVLFLLKKGAAVNENRNDGRTVLHAAVETEDINLVHMLLEHQADVNARDDQGKSPLSLAIATINDTWVSEFLAMYLAKLNNKQICAENLRVLEKSEKLNRFYNSCLLEINKMKQYKICYKITIYNVLSKCGRDLGMYARSQNLVRFFKSNEYKLQFPIYCTILKERFYQGLERKELLDIVGHSLNFLWKYFNLTDPLVQHILYFLSFENLQFMATTAQNKKNYCK